MSDLPEVEVEWREPKLGERFLAVNPQGGHTGQVLTCASQAMHRPGIGRCRWVIVEDVSDGN